MAFGLECQLCSARRAGEAMTSQCYNLREPFNNDACVNNFPCSKRDITMLSGSLATLHTHVPITTVKTWDESLIFLHRDSANNTTVTLLTAERIQHKMYLENRDLGIWYQLFQNKVRLFLKACDEDENRSPIFLMDSTWYCPWQSAHLTMVINSNNEALVECIVKPWPQGGSAAAPFWRWYFF